MRPRLRLRTRTARLKGFVVLPLAPWKARMMHGVSDFFLYGHRHPYEWQPNVWTTSTQKMQRKFGARRIGV